MPETDGHFPGERLMQGAVSVLNGERIAHWEMNGAIYHVALHLAVDRWKSITAHAIAKQSGMSAPIWQRDHYSRIIRTPEEYRRQVSYVWHNPESAGLTTGFLRKRY